MAMVNIRCVWVRVPMGFMAMPMRMRLVPMLLFFVQMRVVRSVVSMAVFVLHSQMLMDVRVFFSQKQRDSDYHEWNR